MEVDELNLAVKIFNQSGAAFHPVTAVEVLNAVNLADLGAVDMAANNAVGLMATGHRGEGRFVFGDVFHGGLGFEFQERGERPIAKTHGAAKPIEIKINVENPVVKMRTKLLEQVVEMREAVCLMAMNDEIFFAVCGRMDHFTSDSYITKLGAHELFNEFIVIAGNVDHLCLLSAFSEQFLDQGVVIVPPEPTKLQLPSVDEIAIEIKIFAIYCSQEFEQRLDLRVFGAEMDVRNPD